MAPTQLNLERNGHSCRSRSLVLILLNCKSVYTLFYIKLVGNTKTPSNAPLREAYHRTARPHRRPTEGNSEKIPPYREYKRIIPYILQHLTNLLPTPSHRDVRLPPGFFHKHLRRPSMVRYILLHKHLPTTLPMIPVTKNLEMGPSRTRPYLVRKYTQPDNQPFSENCANRLIQNRQ